MSANIPPTRPPRNEESLVVRQRLYVDATRAAAWGLGLNALLVVIKLAAGVATYSAALIADAVNSIADVASGLAVQGALRVAQADEDDDHPYGHTKAESIAGLCVALLVAFSAGLLALETVKRFAGDLRVPGVVAGTVAAACAVGKEIAYRYTLRTAERVNSSALRAVAWDHRSDALSSAFVALSLFVAPFAGPAGVYFDPIAALCVCLLLIYQGLKIFRSTAAELMDQQADESMVDHVREVAESVEGVQEVEKLRVRKSGIEYFIEIHVEVDGRMSVTQGHRIGHHVKDELLGQMPRVRDVHVHIEPHETTSLAR